MGRGYWSKSARWLNWMGLTKIETTTTAARCLATSTRWRWPSWSAPIVGTSPMRWPALRWRPDQRCAAAGFSSRSTVLLLSELVERVGVVGEGGRADVVRVGLEGADDLGAEVGVGLGELVEVRRQSEDVVEDEDLPVALRTGPDADGRDRDAVGDLGRQVPRHALQHDAEGAGGLDRLGVGQQPLPAPGVAAALASLHLVAAHPVERLGREADVGHDR